MMCEHSDMRETIEVSFAAAPFEIIDGDRGKHYPKQDELLPEGDCLFLSANNVTKQGFSFANNVYISAEKDRQLRKGKLKRGDIVLTTRGTLGNVGYYSSKIPYDDLRINSGMVIIRANAERILPSYLYCFLRSQKFQDQVNGLRSGVAQPQIPIRDLKAVRIAIPPLPTQERIADILSAYDDLIENNRRRMEILEESARLIYRKMLGGKRTNGTKMPLSELADVVMGQSPESSTYNVDGVGLPFHQGVAGFGDRYPINEKWCTAGTRFAEDGDVLFSVRAPVGRINVSREKIVIGRGLAAMRAKNGCQSWLLHTLKNHFSKEDMIGVGCIFASTTKKELFSVELFVPPEVEIEKFEQEVAPMDEQIRVMTDVNLKLAKARDMLLPKLMNEGI